jgi:hypothetical protein
MRHLPLSWKVLLRVTPTISPLWQKGIIYLLSILIQADLDMNFWQLSGMFQVYVSHSNQQIFGWRYQKPNICTPDCRTTYSFVSGTEESPGRKQYIP